MTNHPRSVVSNYAPRTSRFFQHEFPFARRDQSRNCQRPGAQMSRFHPGPALVDTDYVAYSQLLGMTTEVSLPAEVFAS